jgi:hypothetical protein
MLNADGFHHDFENIMMLDFSATVRSESLTLALQLKVPGLVSGRWVKKTRKCNVRAISDPYLRSCKANPITLTSPHLGLPVPSHAYLRIHAACSRVAHLSGAGDYMEKMLRKS